MDVVDAQVHANVLGTEVTLAIMDALGVQAVLFDEYQTTDQLAARSASQYHLYRSRRFRSACELWGLLGT